MLYRERRYVALCYIMLLRKGKWRTFETRPQYDWLVDYLVTLYLHSLYSVNNM